MSSTELDIKDAPAFSNDPDTQKAEVDEQNEVFRRGEGQVDFRTVSWIRAGVIFVKSKYLCKCSIWH